MQKMLLAMEREKVLWCSVSSSNPITTSIQWNVQTKRVLKWKSHSDFCLLWWITFYWIAGLRNSSTFIHIHSCLETKVSEQDWNGFAVMTTIASVNWISIKRLALPRGTVRAAWALICVLMSIHYLYSCTREAKDLRKPARPELVASSMSGVMILSVMSVRTVNVGTTMKSMKPAGNDQKWLIFLLWAWFLINKLLIDKLSPYAGSPRKLCVSTIASLKLKCQFFSHFQ